MEATGSPVAGIRHALAAIAGGRHVVMVNVEADVLVGPGLAARAARAGVVYSLAYGDQPALICELVDWARTAGFEVVAAGKGTKYLPGYHAVDARRRLGALRAERRQVAAGGLNAQMFTSFLDGTKSAIEMAAVANATGLGVPADGLAVPARRRRRAGAACCDRSPTAARWSAPGSSRSSPARRATGRRWSATCAGASTSCSARPTTSSPRASPTTAWPPTTAAATPRCTGRTT